MFNLTWLKDEVADKLLKVLLYMMKLAFWLFPKYRRNIEVENFTGSYRFKTEQGKVNVLVKFNDGEMKISSKDQDAATVTATFADSQALIDFLLADFGKALRNFLKAYGQVLRDIVQVDFGRGLQDFILAHRQALRDFLMAFKKDILQALEGNKIQVTGNLNYLYKFGFMASYPIHPLLNLANKMN